MPTASGQYQLQDYLAELRARGFDGFVDADLITFVNRGNYAVARKSQWYWEETADAFSISPGTAIVTLWPAVGGELQGLRSLDKVVVTTAGQQKVLKPLSDDDFWPWLGKDLTITVNQGEPRSYYIFQQNLYIIPPPIQIRSFLAYYHRRVTPLVSPTDVPITPQDLDEAILLGALLRCHKRANETGLAASVELDLEEFFDAMRDDEEMMMAEQLQ